MQTVEADRITYLQPLNERLRFFLRLGYLFQQYEHTVNHNTVYDAHATLTSLINIISFVNQKDIKIEVLKELERINIALTPLQNSPDIKHGTLKQILSTLSTLRSKLRALSGPIGSELRSDEFLKAVQQKASGAGGLTEYDPPQYSFWLKQPFEFRAQQLKEWIAHYEDLKTAIELVLNLVQESSPYNPRVAVGGVYQQTLDTKVPYQMIKVTLPSQSPYYAEISGGKHRFTVRMFDSKTKPRPTQTSEDVEFQLACCVL